jgi:predicted RNase H-like HicB family nuclease
LAWLEGVTINDEVKEKMKETLLPYTDDIIDNNVVSIFNSLKNSRIKTIEEALDKLKQTESA